MRLHALTNKVPLALSLAAVLFASAASKLHAEGTPPIAAAVRGAIESIAPDTYPDYVWTFIRRGDTVKIKGKGPDRIIAVFGLEDPEVEGGDLILTLASLRTIASSGAVTNCDAAGKCTTPRSANENASDRDKAASSAKSGNGGGKGKGRN